MPRSTGRRRRRRGIHFFGGRIGAGVQTRLGDAMGAPVVARESASSTRAIAFAAAIMRTLRQLRALPPVERSLLLQSFIVFPLTAVAVRWAGVRRTCLVLRRLTRSRTIGGRLM